MPDSWNRGRLNNMFNKIRQMTRRVRQKILFSQIMEFLADSKFNTNGGLSRYTTREYLFELTCHSKAKQVKEITYLELKSFTDHIFKTEPSEWEREHAAKIIRKFFRFCISKNHVAEFPREHLRIIDENDKMSFINKVLNKRPLRKPNLKMVLRVRDLKDNSYKSFREIAKILTKETKKRQHTATIFRWYHHKGVA